MQDYETRRAAAEAAAQALTQAAATQDEAAAKAACTEEGWEDGASPCRGLFRQVTKKGLNFDTLGEAHVFRSRAAQWATLSRPDQDRPLGDLWILLEDIDGAWKVQGATKQRPHVGLFLEQAITATVSVADLPPSADADAWLSPRFDALASGQDPEIDDPSGHLDRLRAPEGVSIEPIQSIHLAAVHRAAAGLRFTDPGDAYGGRDAWFVLDVSATPPTLVAVRPWLSLESLLTDLDVAWPKEDMERPGERLTLAASAGVATGDARDRLRAALAEALATRNGELDANDPRAQVSDQLMGMVDEILEAQAGGPSSKPRSTTAPSPATVTVAAAASPAPSADAPSGRPPPPAPAGGRPLTLPPALEQAMQGFIDEQSRAGNIEGDQVKVDSAFMRDHGPKLVGKLLAGFFQEVMPKDLELELPVRAPEGQAPPTDDEGRPMKVKVDLGDIFGKLFQAKAPSASPEAPGDASPPGSAAAEE